MFNIRIKYKYKERFHFPTRKKLKINLKKTVFTFGFCFSRVRKQLSPRCIERRKVRAPCYLVKIKKINKLKAIRQKVTKNHFYCYKRINNSTGIVLDYKINFLFILHLWYYTDTKILHDTIDFEVNLFRTCI